MSDFRKVILALAVVALMATSAFAQSTPINCSVQASNPTVRVEGITELVGDVYIRCTGNLLTVDPAPATAAVPTVTVLVNYNAPITNRTVNGSMTDAVLFIGYNDLDNLTGVPGPTTANVNPCNAGSEDTATGQCPGLINDGTAVPGFSRQAGSPQPHINVFQGIRQSTTTIQFTSVPFNQYPIIGAAPCPGGVGVGNGQNCPFVRVFRVKNVRLGIAGNLSNNSPVSASVFFTNPAQPTPGSLSNIIFSNNTQQVGFVNTGLIFAWRTASGGSPSAPVGFGQCETVNARLASSVTERYGGSGSISGRTATLRYTEGFPSAFKTRLRYYDAASVSPGSIWEHQIPSEQYQARFETGWFSSPVAAVNANYTRVGYSDHGTRVRAVFAGVPTGMRLYTTAMPVSGSSSTVQAYAVFADINGANLSASNGVNTSTVFRQPTAIPSTTDCTLYEGQTATWPAGGAGLGTSTVGSCTVHNINSVIVPPGVRAALQGLSLVEMPMVASGTMSGASTWEVVIADPAAVEQLTFGVAAAYSVTNLPASTVTVAGSLAPVSTTTGQSSNPLVPVQRFVDTGSAQTILTISPCITNLLYPFVTAVPGFNTGIAVANTSDTTTTSSSGTVTNVLPGGVATQQGPCTFYYYGEGPAGAAPPSPQTSGVVPAGKVLIFNVAGGSANYGTINGTPGFQGYMIARCEFRYAHGYAFISDNNLALFAQGYLALILDNSLLPNRGVAAEILGN
jgi:hypothetical protein